MNLTRLLGVTCASTALTMSLFVPVFVRAQDAPPSGAQMMEDLVRLTMVPLAEEPLTFEGHLACELSSSGRATVGELRWDGDGTTVLWSDAIDRRGLYTVHLTNDQPLATINLEHGEGNFMTPDMMTLAGYWHKEGDRPSDLSLKLDKKADLDTLMGKACTRYVGKRGKSRVAVWMADPSDAGMSQDALDDVRRAWITWMHHRPGDGVMRHVLLPKGLPLKVEWGAPLEDGSLPMGMTTLTLNPAAAFELDAPALWMHVPGRDINQVAREMKEQQEKAAGKED